MALPEFTRTIAFRWALAITAALALCILVMFGVVYWQITGYADAAVDRLNEDAMGLIVATPPEGLRREVERHLQVDPLRLKLTGLFDRSGVRTAGNIESIPPALIANETPHVVSVVRVDAGGREEQRIRAVARRLADGETVIVGRKADQMQQIAGTLRSALALGLIPALGLGLAAGIFLSLRGQRRVAVVGSRVRRIVSGHLHERLPTRGVNDPFDRLAVLVNGMLDEIESLVRNLAGVGDDMAHDLRTPLTRVRVSLERARQKAGTLEELRASVDQAIIGLDQSLAIVTALLRIAEIEHSRRMAGFGDVALGDLVREVGDLYEPIAEDKKVAFAVEIEDAVNVHGDRDLLFEATANLVDNAVKFTPAGGRVALHLFARGNEAVVQVRDDGPGIDAKERDLVGRRFYRSDKSRRSPGLGLGLSLVNAIVKLHGFNFSIGPGPGCVVEISGPRQTSAARREADMAR